MFHPIEGGSAELIYKYNCHIPPEGYGKNVITGELEFVGVISCSPKKSEQKWFITPLPKDWEKKRRKELDRMSDDPEYFDTDLEAFRQQEWKRRLCGVWVMINGRAVYITGLHYFYLNWVQIDIGHPEYRDNDRKFFYVWRFCEEDPNCGGMVQAARRREGKTFKGGAILLEYISRTKNVNAGIQSKTSADAKGVFLKAVVNVFKKLPDFFRPVFDTSKGLTPTSDLRFTKTTKKGSRALEDIDKPELDSFIDWKSSDIFAYDGTKQTRHFEDEVGKTMEVCVYDRWFVNRYCVEQDGKWIGKAILSTTVEEMENGGESFKKLWMASNPDERDKNGRTKSGLYRLFFPAYETTMFDEYGMPKIEQATEFFVNQRDGLKDDPRGLSSIIRKNPFTEEEMFRVDGDRCLYDAMKLNDQLDRVTWSETYTTRGEFVWANGERDTKVEWQPKKNGRFEICWIFPDPKDANKVEKRGSAFIPLNKNKFIIGCDPFDHSQTGDRRRSDGAAVCLRKFDATLKEGDPYNYCPVAKYRYRPESALIFYEDILKMAWYFGSPVLFENQKLGIKNYFNDRNCSAFLLWLPGRNEPGIPASQKVHQQIAELTEEYVRTNCHKIFYKDLLKDLLEFEIENTGPYDTAMSFGYTLIGDQIKMAKQSNTVKEVTEYFRRYKVQ